MSTVTKTEIFEVKKKKFIMRNNEQAQDEYFAVIYYTEISLNIFLYISLTPLKVHQYKN